MDAESGREELNTIVTGSPIGFIGFGEAGSCLARGLKESGARDVFAYDIRSGASGPGETIRRSARETGVALLESSAELVSSAGILLSTVTADNAVAAARQTAPYLGQHHLYADMNSVAPKTKEAVAAIVAESGASFVEVAIMGPVPPLGHRVPMILAGPSAKELIEELSPYGMSLEIVSETIGSAAAVKLCRSIIVKGLEALMLECALAASEYGADERVFESLNQSFPGLDWKRLAGYMISRVVLHGGRRAREMDEAAGMLTSIGIEPVMTEAAARRQDWCAGLDVKRALGSESPEDYRAVIEAIRVLTKGT